jgi:hypothetical protein
VSKQTKRPPCGTEDDIGPYKRHELLTGNIYYPALGYSGYGDGKSTHIADFVTHEMRQDWLANRDRLLAFWKSGEPISKYCFAARRTHLR